ncbi:MAG: hypothetical protein P4M11_14115 [Candidatus Pacebacteria bacterium]|nr:hypothetical protein [Candidatus Paceibacterota bacterium]
MNTKKFPLAYTLISRAKSRYFYAYCWSVIAIMVFMNLCNGSVLYYIVYDAEIVWLTLLG